MSLPVSPDTPDIANITAHASAEAISMESLNLTLTDKVESKLREVIPSEDPLDSASFDVIDHINSLFPTEESLGDVHDGPLAFRIQHIARQVHQIDAELSKAVQDAAKNRNKTKSAIHETQSSIQQLLQKVHSIGRKAEESEKMVNEICSDIRKLDNAKKNLSESITTLQKLHMLVSGVEQLQKDASTKSYERAAQLVQALDDLFEHFAPHLSLTQLKSLKLDMDKCREVLRRNIYSDFRSDTPEVHPDPQTRQVTLRSACQVVEVLGDEEREEFIRWVSSMQLQAYGAIFSPGGDKSGIEHLQRRFDYLKKSLLKYNANYNHIFPRWWNVCGVLCRQFCDITKQHLVEVLKQSEQINNMDVNEMVKALEQCVTFEKDLQRLYSRPSQSEDLEKIKVDIQQLLGDYDEAELYAEPLTAEKIKLRYKYEALMKQQHEVEAQIARQQKKQNARVRAQQDKIEPIEFMNTLSSAFVNYMQYYVQLEKQSIADVLADIRKNEHWMCTLQTIPSEARYAGIDDLLGYIKSSIVRCAKIGTEYIFYQIYHEYRTGLEQYVELLQQKVTAMNTAVAQKNRNSSSKNIDDELIALCLVVNTLEYLRDTLPAVQSKLQSCITEAKLLKKIDLKKIEEGTCVDLAVDTIKCMAQNITEKIGVMFDREIASCRRWHENEASSSDRSTYLSALKAILYNDVALVHEVLLVSYHNTMNSQIERRLLPKYTACIFGIRRLSVQGVTELQLDTRELERLLLRLPMIGMEGESSESECPVLLQMNVRPNQNKSVRPYNPYKNEVTRQISKIQCLLKTINNTPNTPDRLDDIAIFYKDVFSDKNGKKGHFQDLSRICEIKGLRKHEIQSVITTYNRMVALHEQSKPMIAAQNNKNDDLFNIPLGLLKQMTSGSSVFKK